MKLSNRELEQGIARAVLKETPDVLARVLLELNEREGETEMYHSATDNNLLPIQRDKLTVYHKKSKAIPLYKKVAAVAAMLVLVAGAFLSYSYMTPQATISFDVNPSVELRVNRNEKVLAAIPLNAEAELILSDMNLKNTDLNVAVNALIGSMVKNGFISEAKNSILITVDSANDQKGRELQQRLSDEVGSLLDAYSVHGAVLSQTVTEDQRLKDLATEYGITQGKAALVDLLVSQDPTLSFEDVSALSINEINLLIAVRQTSLEGVNTKGAASTGAYIGETRAKEIAFAHATVSERDATSLKVKLDYEKGRMVYEVEFRIGNSEYEYEIDALTGSIVKYDVEVKSSSSAGNSSTDNANSTGNLIGDAKAKSIALNHAGLSDAEATVVKLVHYPRNRQMVYDIMFFSSNARHTYLIDAYTGEIISNDRDTTRIDVHAAITSHGRYFYDGEFWSNYSGSSSSASSSKDISGYIGEDRAKSIALTHAGVAESAIISYKGKLDYDHGVAIYEVEFQVGSDKYEYEIDATTGSIVDYEWKIKSTSTGSSGTGSYIGADKAKSIALNHAGVKETAVTRYEVELDKKHDTVIYEVEFRTTSDKYEYEIDATTGEILSSKVK